MPRKLQGSVQPYRDRFMARVGGEYLGLFDTRQEAWDTINAWLRVEGKKGSVPDTLTIWGRAWMDRRETDGLVRGIRQERSVWRAHIETAPFADWPMRRIRPKHVHDWVRKLLKKRAVDTIRTKDGPVHRETDRTMGRQTVVHALKLLRLCLDDAAVQGKLPSNPAREVKVPRVDRVIEDSDAWAYLTLEEIDRLFAVLTEPEDRAIFAVAIYCGLRRGELWGLRWQDVELDADDPHLRIRRAYAAPLKERASRRTVPLFPPARDALRAWQRAGGIVRARGIVFPSPSGGVHSRSYHAGWYDHRQRFGGELRIRQGWRSKAGVRPYVRFHDLRHTFCSHLAMGSWGWPRRRVWTLRQIQAVAGHSSPTVTNRYAHLSPGSVHDVARSMEHATKVQQHDDEG